MRALTPKEADERWPEHAKASKVRDELNAITGFIEWAESKDISLVDTSEKWDQLHDREAQNLVFEYLSLDVDKFWAEKDDMLAFMRGETDSPEEGS